MRHGIPFATTSLDFPSREDVVIWIIWNQISRRNLSPIQLSHFRGIHYRAERTIITNKDGKNQYSEVDRQSDDQPQTVRSTTQRLSELYRVSPKTIERDSSLSKGVEAIGNHSPDAKMKILSGETRISRTTLQSLSAMPPEDIAAIASMIDDGTYSRDSLNELMQPGGTGPGGVDAGGGNSSFVQSLEDIFSKTAEKISSELTKLSSQGDAAEIKSALRAYISMLEDIYGKF